jgi:hypothetical protein
VAQVQVPPGQYIVDATVNLSVTNASTTSPPEAGCFLGPGTTSTATWSATYQTFQAGRESDASLALSWVGSVSTTSDFTLDCTVSNGAAMTTSVLVNHDGELVATPVQQLVKG